MEAKVKTETKKVTIAITGLKNSLAKKNVRLIHKYSLQLKQTLKVCYRPQSALTLKR